ncbi:DUF4382 domain-containing protein [Thiomicrorhabdus sp. ZW0627]|uniref:DUF4382 domain-containing protein n=1 Tax=Thiomicrorhabdus sp. ZW0627 TaxID=3039774 RepID=UPI002436A428|nr:DUF4382 domain-containing protein [Thiomicrorhabdus sp. ZW0627]MDG6773415.1 DUF4382 domain-containing protein [Thiomicrorhabdus sp. ZW0627]
MKKKLAIGIVTLPLLLTGCGGSSSSSGTGTLNLSLTDAPIDEAQAVWVEFTGVSIKKQNDDPEVAEEWIDITFDQPKSINLLTLQGAQNIELLTGQTLEAGTYSEIRLHVNAVQDGVEDSYITLDDGNHELDIPSGSQTGLKVKGDIVVEADQAVGFTVDFDVRKSIVVLGTGEYKLKPVLHLTQDTLTGHIAGTVETQLLTSLADNWTCSDEDPNTYNAVYIYLGADATPVDISGGATDPVSTALVNYNADTTSYEFEAGYLTAGTYTVSFTCHADAENTEVSGDDLHFIGTQNVTVTAGETATVNIVAP